MDTCDNDVVVDIDSYVNTWQVSCPGCGAGGLTPEQTGER